MTNILSGAGGGGSSPTIVNDNIRSQDSVEFILALGEGPIAGLIEGPKSFYLGDTPLVSASGQRNFENFQINVFHGSDTPSRVKPAFGGLATNVPVNVTLARYVPVIRTTPSNQRGLIDRLEVRIAFNQLLRTTDDGDQLETTAKFRLQYKKSTDTDWLPFTGSKVLFLTPNNKYGMLVSATEKKTTAAKSEASLQLKVLSSSLKADFNKKLTNLTVTGSTVYSGPMADYNRVKSLTYSDFYFHTTTGLYKIVPKDSGLANITAEDVTETLTVKAEDGRGVDRTITFTFTSDAVGVVSFKGKTGTTYIKEYVRNLGDEVPAYTGDYDIKVEKLTEEGNPNIFVNMSWESFQCVNTDADLRFNNTALIHGIGAASAQLSNLPTFSALVAGGLVKIPSNYNPITRVYSGTWDGTFKLGYTDNLAWCLYDLIMDTRFGFKKHIPNIKADRWSFYEAAQWCDVLVPRTGSFGYQPRYTFHDYIDQPRNPYEMAQYMAAVMGAILVSDLNNTVSLKLDKATNPVQIFSLENTTVEGFQYQFADMTTRVNDMRVTFINPELGWNQDVIQVSNPDLIEQNGRIPQDFVAVGCIDRFEAERRAWFRLISANTEVTTVTFTTTRPGIALQPFDVIGISDPFNGWGLSGRLAFNHGGAGEFLLRDTLYVLQNLPLIMTLQTNSGPIELSVMNVESSPNTKRLVLQSGVKPALPETAVFTLSAADDTVGLVKPFRILTIDGDDRDENLFTITAVEVNVNKQGDADTLGLSPTVRYSYERSSYPSTPTEIEVESGTDHLYIDTDGRVQSRIYVKWEQDLKNYTEEFEVHYRRIDRDRFTVIKAQGQDCYIPNVQDGMTYQIFVKAVNVLGRKSPDSAVIQHTVVGKNANPTAPINLVTYQQGADVVIVWDAIPDLDASHYEVYANDQLIGSPVTAQMTHYNATGQSITYKVRSVDTTGHKSTFTTVVHNMTQPGLITLTGSISDVTYVLRWNTPESELPINHYIVRDVTNGLILDATLKATSFRVTPDWLGERVFSVEAVNSAGAAGGLALHTATIAAPKVLNLQSKLYKSVITLTWDQDPGTLPTKQYHLFEDDSGSDALFHVLGLPAETGTSAIIASIDAKQWSKLVDWEGVHHFYVAAEDIAGNIGPVARVTERVDPPEIVDVTSSVVDRSIRLAWTEPSSELRIVEYEVLYAGNVIAKVAATSVLIPINFTGARTYSVRAIDEAGNVGVEGTETVMIVGPGAFVASGVFTGDQVRLSWTDSVGTLALDYYQITRGAGQPVADLFANSYTLKADFTGAETFSIVAYDVAGNASPVQQVTLTASPAGQPTVQPEVIDNNVLLRWTPNPGTLPVVGTEIRRGATYATSVFLQTVDATFAAFFENAAGNYTYWLTHIDSAGAYGTPTPVTTQVNQPPDYLLQADYVSTFNGTTTRSWIYEDQIYLGVDPAETFEQHFTSVGASSIQDQIGMGYNLWLQPVTAMTAQYQEVYDYGALLAASLITVSVTAQTLGGNPSIEVDIETKAALADPWVMIGSNVSQILGTNFRYVRFTVRLVKDTRDDLMAVSRINLRLNTKQKNDAGNGYANAADIGGTQVFFTSDFIDVSAISVTPLATTPIFGVYDFQDVPYPTSFKVLLFDAAGNRVSGNFSWTARGF